MLTIVHRIVDEAEANAIINRVNQLIQTEKKLTEKDEDDYLFANILLEEIKKRKQTLVEDCRPKKEPGPP